MEFKDIDINFHKDFVMLKYKDEKIILYKSVFQENRTRICFFQEGASIEFVKSVFKNINFLEMYIDKQSKKYFIDMDEEPEFEYILDELNFNRHSNFASLYFKSYSMF